MKIENKLLEHYKDSYFYELDRKDKINAYLNLPLVIFTLLIAFVSFLLNSLPEFLLNVSSIVFYLLFLLLIISMICAFYFFIRSFYNYSYYYVSTPSEIDNYFNKLVKYNEKVKEVKKVNLEEKYSALMKKQYSKYATINTKNNDRKSKYLYKTSTTLILSLILAFFTCFPYFYIKYSVKEQNIVITKFMA